MKQKNKKNAGFSLIELLFTMLFLSVIVFGVIKLQTSSLTLANSQKMELKASHYVTQGLEIIDALGHAAIKECPSSCHLEKSSNYELKPNVPENDAETLGLFKRKIAYTQPGGLVNASLVTVTVSWTDSAGDHDVSAKRVVW